MEELVEELKKSAKTLANDIACLKELTEDQDRLRLLRDCAQHAQFIKDAIHQFDLSLGRLRQQGKLHEADPRRTEWRDEPKYCEKWK